MAITLTKKAADELNRIIESKKIEGDVFLRVGVIGGGCSGFTYRLDVVDATNKSDETFESNGVTITCDPKSLIYLDGSEIDFESTMMKSGFVFNNPNHSCCGCGESFCPS